MPLHPYAMMRWQTKSSKQRMWETLHRDKIARTPMRLAVLMKKQPKEKTLHGYQCYLQKVTRALKSP